jgi:hypothetical protein
VIPAGARCADELIRKFRVDVLVDIADDPKIKVLMERFSHLPWPLFDPALFRAGHGPHFLDVSHPLRSIAEQPQEEGIPFQYSNQVMLVHWQNDDPLKDFLLATFGAYPATDEIGVNFEDFVKRSVNTSEERLIPGEPVPADLLDQRTPSELSREDLVWDRSPHHTTMGFYVGSANDFEDILNYWNLRASDLAILFLDPAHLKRLSLLKTSHSEFIRQRTNKEIAVWSRSQQAVQQAFVGDLPSSYWAINGLNAIQGNFRPPLQYLSEKSALASLSEQYGRLTLAFQLPDKPFSVEPEWSDQHFVVSIRPGPAEGDEASTFWTPYLPKLNEWYGRNVNLRARSVRAEIDGIGIITRIADDSLTLRSIRKQDLAAKMFELAGLDAKPSLPGRIASRLISQLGGLQGCRVLKIGGVRRLIRNHGPLQDFDRTEAMRTIGNSDPVTGQPRFEDYEGLFIEQRDSGVPKLKPEHAFLYLLDRGVFRVGLTLTCPICELPSWVNLDDLSTLINCELCGGRFNLTRQLKDRAWAYRRSGLFGRENHQEGSIPVALTLQQLDTQLHPFGGVLFSTNMSLAPAKANVQSCETDIFLALAVGDQIQIAIGECKDAGGHIELDDAKKLAAVADSFPRREFDVFIVFSKTAAFTAQDVENCRAAQPKGGGLRVIMLSDRELEPYFVYEKTGKEFEIKYSGVSLEHMARVTHDVFFAPKPASRTAKH